MNIREVLALNVRKFREARRLSQEELADRADVDRTYVSSIERCRYSTGVDVIDRIARVFGVEASDLLKRPNDHGERKKARS